LIIHRDWAIITGKDKGMTVYVCEGSFEGILCGVYDAWMSRKGHENVRLELENSGDMELFCSYEPVALCQEKAKKVISAIHKRLSEFVYEQVYLASLSHKPERADRIYRFLVDAFRYGDAVLKMFHLSSVFDLFALCRFVEHESHQLTGFLRFSRTEQGLLISRIGPESDVVALLAVHFADRLPSENWMIYDEHRKKAVVHPADKDWFILQEDEGNWIKELEWKTDEEEYAALWKIFHQTVAISERVNLVCQRSLLPLRYRGYMTEFMGK